MFQFFLYSILVYFEFSCNVWFFVTLLFLCTKFAPFYFQQIILIINMIKHYKFQIETEIARNSSAVKKATEIGNFHLHCHCQVHLYYHIFKSGYCRANTLSPSHLAGSLMLWARHFYTNLNLITKYIFSHTSNINILPESSHRPLSYDMICVQ